jgi:hypothetical protein
LLVEILEVILDILETALPDRLVVDVDAVPS